MYNINVQKLSILTVYTKIDKPEPDFIYMFIMIYQRPY